MANTARKTLNKQSTGSNNNTWGDELNTVLDNIDKSLAGVTSKSVTVADVTLSTDEARSPVQVTTGVMTGNRNYIVPTSQAYYLIVNACTGGFNLTVKTSGGTGIVCPTNACSIVYCDGTNVVDATPATITNNPNPISSGTVDTTDLVLVHDISQKSDRSITFALLLKVINNLTEDTAPDPTADYVVTYDDSASAAKKVLTKNLAQEVIGVALSDETTELTAATSVVTIRMPFAMTVTAVRASLSTASSSGLVTVDINESGSTILTTKLSIDANEKTSTTAATPAVIGGAGPALADDAEITFDIDADGTGAKGLKVYMIGRRT